VLWLLDAVSIGFTAFQLFTILLLESTSVFQRQRTLKTLNGMSAKPYALSVFRAGSWLTRTTTDLLPGDLISLVPPRAAAAAVASTTVAEPSAQNGGASVSSPQAQASAAPPASATPTVGGCRDIVPCDCLLLRGTAVVNEASLTGESVPQMKDQLDGAAGSTRLDVNATHRVHTLFAGTSLIAATPGSAVSSASSVPSVPAPPDGGAVCFVLRSGFSSAQGELMQMIEFAQQPVSDDSKETMGALMLLFCFALASSAYVFKRGLEKGTARRTSSCSNASSSSPRWCRATCRCRQPWQ
jgi:cation-transporting ATPase 13A1